MKLCVLLLLLPLATAHDFLAMSKQQAVGEWEKILRRYPADTVTPAQLRELLQAGAAVDTPDFYGRTMLMTCFTYRHPHTFEIVRTLLAAGANVNKTNFIGATALVYFFDYSHSNNRSLLALLLHAGADVNKPDRSGNTALHLAACRSHSLRMVRMLINAGADPKIANVAGQTPLDFARYDCDCGYTNTPEFRRHMVAMLTQKIKLA